MPQKSTLPETPQPASTTPKSKGSAPLPLSDLPSKSLKDVLRVPQGLIDCYAGAATAPHDLALALDMSPTSSSWRDLASVSAAYGLTKGGWNAGRIGLEPLGRSAIGPEEDNLTIRARAEAVLKPSIHKGFFNKYNKSKFPPDHIAKSVLQSEFKVPASKAELTLKIIKENGSFVGFIRETKTGPFVAIEQPQTAPVKHTEGLDDFDSPTANLEENGAAAVIDKSDVVEIKVATPTKQPAELELRVFITHGKNFGIVEQVKDILSLYDIEYEVAVEEETAAIPVPAKVMSAMRRCSAGVMVVTADEKDTNDEGFHINVNVLIEIGAAFVLYDQKVILLWDRRLKVPSNLQGLYRLEFEGNELSFATGTKLAKTVKSLLKKG